MNRSKQSLACNPCLSRDERVDQCAVRTLKPSDVWRPFTFLCVEMVFSKSEVEFRRTFYIVVKWLTTCNRHKPFTDVAYAGRLGEFNLFKYSEKMITLILEVTYMHLNSRAHTGTLILMSCAGALFSNSSNLTLKMTPLSVSVTTPLKKVGNGPLES